MTQLSAWKCNWLEFLNVTFQMLKVPAPRNKQPEISEQIKVLPVVSMHLCISIFVL